MKVSSFNSRLRNVFLSLGGSLALCAAVILALQTQLAGAAPNVGTIAVTTFADELTVNANCSLREAIRNYNSNANTYPECTWPGTPVTITLSAGTYTITIPTSNEDANLDGDFDVTASGGLTIVGAGAGSTTITTNQSDRIFDVDSGGDFTLRDVTVTGGNTPNVGAGMYVRAGNVTLDGITLANNDGTFFEGGGIYNAGTLTIRNSTLDDNTNASSGGGVYNTGTLTVLTSTVSNNSASASGGGIYNSSTGSLSLTNVNFYTNSVTTFDGGAVVHQGNNVLTVTGGIFQNNRAQARNGGAIALTTGNSHLVVLGTVFYSNTASDGGALRNNVSGGNMLVTNATFGWNSASRGGAVFVENGVFTATNSAFTANAATGGNQGGAIYNNGAASVWLNAATVISGNTAGQGGGIANFGTLTLANVIVRNNTGSGGPGGIYAPAGGTLIIDSSTFQNNTGNGSIAGGAIGQNGGTLRVTNSFFYTNTSFFPGAGIAATAPGLAITNTVFQGNATNGAGGGVSVGGAGAFGLMGGSFINNTASQNTGAGGALAISSSGVATAITNTTFTDNQGVGGGRHGGAISDAGSRLTISGASFANNTSGGNGGAIYRSTASGSLSLNNVTFSNNTGGAGGAVSVPGGNTVWVTSTTFTSNTASVGGAMAAAANNTVINITGTQFISNTGTTSGSTGGGAIHLNGGALASITNTTFAGNRMPADHGGAIFFVGSTGPLNLTNVNFYTNSAGFGSGAVRSDGMLNMVGGSFQNNFAALGGGAVGSGGVANLDSVTFYSNTTSAGQNGGALLLNGGNIQNSTFAYNQAGVGGAINTTGALTLSNNSFYSNTASVAGGALALASGSPNVTLLNSLFMGNQVTGTAIGNNGGAVYMGAGRATIRNTIFTGNTSHDSGGAVAGRGGTSLDIENSSFTNNAIMLDHGGAIETIIPTAITNSTFYSNTAPNSAGFDVGSAAVRLVNNTFYQNRNTAGGPTVSGLAGSTLHLQNNIIAGTLQGADCAIIGATLTGSNNLVQDGTCSAAFSGNPNLGAPANIGLGGTLVLPLQTGSPAIDAGTPAGAPATDQTGATRPKGCYPDVGAHEFTGYACPIPMNGLALWLDSSDPDNDNNPANNPANGASLPIWLDKSGSNNNATTLGGQVAATFVSTASQQINTHPVVYFTRTSATLGSAYNVAGVDIRAITNQDVTIFTVYRPKSLPGFHGVWGNDNGNWDRFFLAYAPGFGDNVDDGLASLGPVGQGVVVPDAGQIGVVRLMATRYDGNVVAGSNNGPAGRSAVYFDGQVVTRFTDSTDASNAQSSFRLGGDGDDSTFHGDIAEVLVYNRALTDAEICAISSALGVKYGRSFACAAPGGVGANIALWLKANSNVYQNVSGTVPAVNNSNVLNWTDLTGNVITQAQILTTTNITYLTNAANYNPAVQFGGASLQRLVGAAATPFSGTSTIFAIAKDQGTPSGILGGIFASVDDPVPASHAGQGIYFTDDSYQMDGVGAFGPNTANTVSPIGNNYHLVAGRYGITQTTQGTSIYLDGRLEETHNGAGVPLTSGPIFEIGGRTWQAGSFNNRILKGQIAEVIYYAGALTPAEQARVESYLAIKYGLTLSATLNYVDSASNIVWNGSANAAYYNDVAGIGVDSLSALNQLRSRSIYTDDVVSIWGQAANIATGEFLLWGNNNAVYTASTNVPPGYTQRFLRIWKTQETGDTGALTVTFDLNGIPGINLAAINRFALLTDADGDFSNATVITGAVLNGTQVTFSNVNLGNAQFFSLAYPALSTINPGGVGSPVLWLKANAGVTPVSGTVTNWVDQTGVNVFALNGNPQIGTNSYNYNPAVTFDGNGDYLVGDTPITFTEAFMAGSSLVDGGRPLAGDGVSGGGCGAYFFSSAGTSMYTGDADPSYLRLTSTDPDGYRLLNSSLNGGGAATNSRIAINGADQPVAALVPPGDGGPLSPFYRVPLVSICGDRAGGFFTGPISEILLYDRVLTDSERLKINSYLALKYGVTLSSTLNYVDSTGSTYWSGSANSAYYNDVAGIGRDDASALMQLRSIGINSDAFVSISTTAFSTDRSFLVWGNNDLTTTIGITSGAYLRMGRIWKVQKSGSVATATVSIPASYAAQYLLVDADGDFSSGAIAVALTASGGNLVANFDFPNGYYFTFGNTSIVLQSLVSYQPNPPTVGNPVTFTLQISNSGNGPATGAYITFTVPPGNIIGSPLPAGCTVNSNVITCGPATVPGPGSVTYTPILITPMTAGTQTYTTTTSATGVPPTSGNTNVNVQPISGDLAFARQWIVVQGLTRITYTLVVTNLLNIPQTNVIVSGSIPLSATLMWANTPVSSTTGGDFNSGYVSSLPIPSLGAQQSTSISWSIAASRPNVANIIANGCYTSLGYAISDQAAPRMVGTHYICRILFSPVVKERTLSGP